MTRRMMQPDDDNFRVVVRRKKKTVNPEYGQGNRQPYWILLDEEYDSHYGPYPKIGTARGVQAREAYEPACTSDGGEPRSQYQWDTVDTWIEKVREIIWERVPE